MSRGEKMKSKVLNTKLLFWILVPVAICLVSISMHIFDDGRLQKNSKILKFLSGIVDSDGKLMAIRKLLGLSRVKEYSYNKFPILRPKLNLRDNNRASTWNDLGVVLQGKWYRVPLEASLMEFLSEFYQGTGRGLEELVGDLVGVGGKGLITAKMASDLVGDNLGVKLMETMVINRYYSPRIESMRTLERAQRRVFGIICKKASWIILVYREETVDTFCDSSDLYGSIMKGRSKGLESAEKYDLSFSRQDLGKEHILESQSGRVSEISGAGARMDMEVYAYIDFSDAESGEILRDIWNVWDIIKDQGKVRIKIRHCDHIGLKEGFEYLTGFGVSVSKLTEGHGSGATKNLTIEDGVQSWHPFSQNSNEELNKSHKDDEYESLSAMCDKAVNMENVLDSDGELSIDCMRDIGAYLVSLSKRFEDQLGAMMHYLENFGTYQLALCNGVRENTTLSGYGRLHERVSEGSTFFTLNGRLFSPSETSFFNLVTILKNLIFSRIWLKRNHVDDETVLTDSLSTTGVNEREELNLFVEGLRVGLNESRMNSMYDAVIKDEDLKGRMKRGEILDSDLVREFEEELERDPSLMDDLGWLGRREYVLSGSSPWVRSSPRTDWRVTNTLPLKTRHFYKDITNIGDSQWGETPSIFEKVWFNRNLTEKGHPPNQEYTSSGLEEGESNQTSAARQLEYSPWIMYRMYFSSQVRNSRLVQEYVIYDIMKEPESALGQYLYPLESLPELFEKHPENAGIYPVKAAILDIIVLCDPLDIECITVIIEIINRKWPIRLNLLLMDPEWVNLRKPDYSIPFSYVNVTSEEDFEAKFRDVYEERRGENRTVCERYYGKENVENCPEWLRRRGELEGADKATDGFGVYNEGSGGDHALKLAISEVFGFLVSSSTTQGMFLARAFLEMIAKNLPLLLERDYTLSQFKDFLDKFFSHFSINAELSRVWEMIYSNNPNDNSYVNKVASYCRLKGLTSPGALINGHFVEITDLVLEEVVYGIAKKEQRMIMEGVRQGKITSGDDIYSYILNNTVTGISSVPVVFPPFTKSVKFENWPFIGIQSEWKHVEREIGLKLQAKYGVAEEGEEAGSSAKNGSRSFSAQDGGLSGSHISILEEEEGGGERTLLDLLDLETLDYSILWDSNPELRHNMESVEKNSQSTPWITFIVLIRSSRTGLLGLSTLIDYWVSTLSYQASMQLNQYNELLFNRRFKIMFIPSGWERGRSPEDDISFVLERCLEDALEEGGSWERREDNSLGKRRPILDRLRFIKWFVKVVLENMEALADGGGEEDLVGGMGERVVEIYVSLFKSFFGREGNGRLDDYLEDLDLIRAQQRVKEKLARKFSSEKERDVISFPYSSSSNGKLKGFPKHASYNLGFDKSDERYGRGSFEDSNLSSRSCLETFSMGVVINGVYLRVCPNTYPVYLRKDVKVDYWSSPIHSVHLKLLETAVTSRMRQLVFIGEFKRFSKKEDILYRRRWSKLDPNKMFILLSEHLHVSNMFKSEPLVQLEDIFSSSSSLVKLHLPTVNRGGESSSSQQNALIGVVAVVNPMTVYSSRILRLFDVLHQLFEADVKLVYNPVLDYRSMREVVLMNTWRRYVFNYPKLKAEGEAPRGRGMVSLKELMHSRGDPSEFKIGKDDLYYLNSQLVAKFDIQTEKGLQVSIEKSNGWRIDYLKTVSSQSGNVYNNNRRYSTVPGGIFRAGGDLLVYELKGKEFEATFINLKAEAASRGLRDRIKEIHLVPLSGLGSDLEDDKGTVPVQKIYSVTEFNSFFGYLGVGWNELILSMMDKYADSGREVREGNSSSREESSVLSFPLEIFNQRLFEDNTHFVIHLSRLFKSLRRSSYLESKRSPDSKGQLSTLHILCLSTQTLRGEFDVESVDKLLSLIDKVRYSKLVVYIDSRYVSQTIRDYLSYRLFWKYYITVEYLEITRPRWIPTLPSCSNNSIMDILLTLEYWIPPSIDKLLVLDPFSLDITSDLRDYFELLSADGGHDSNVNINNGTENRHLLKVGDSALVFPKKSGSEDEFNAKMGLLFVDKYKRIGSYLKKAYFELYRDFETDRVRIKQGGGATSQNIMELFTWYLRNQIESVATSSSDAHQIQQEESADRS